MIEKDIYYMGLALLQAKEAAKQGEVPIGAILVYKDEVVGKGYNLRERLQNPIAHAEIIALQEGAQKLKSWRLDGSSLYVTLEPCPMCAGAIMQARVKRLIYAASDPKAGAIKSLLKLFEIQGFNHKVEVTSGVLATESSKLLKDFFRDLRAGRLSGSD